MLELNVIRDNTWELNHNAINRWMDNRQQLLIRFCGIIAVRPLSALSTRYALDFQQFSELMVDYTSCGHFDIFERLMTQARAQQNLDGIHAFLKQHYSVISASTECIVHFNDNFVDADNPRGLTRALSRLGDALEARFKAGDAMPELLHYSAKPLHLNQF